MGLWISEHGSLLDNPLAFEPNDDGFESEYGYQHRDADSSSWQFLDGMKLISYIPMLNTNRF